MHLLSRRLGTTLAIFFLFCLAAAARVVATCLHTDYDVCGAYADSCPYFCNGACFSTAQEFVPESILTCADGGGEFQGDTCIETGYVECGKLFDCTLDTQAPCIDGPGNACKSTGNFTHAHFMERIADGTCPPS